MTKFRRIFASLTAAAVSLSLLAGCSGSSGNAKSIDWSSYDSGVADVYAMTDYAERESALHALEDRLMETWSVLPIYYFTHAYMCKSDVAGVYSSPFGMLYYMNASKSGASTLNIYLSSEPDTLDPALNVSTDGSTLALNSFTGLYTIDKNGDPAPALVGASAVSDDGLTYTFELIESKWSNGKALTAEDFVYSWNRAAADETGAPYSYLFSVFARNDDGTLAVTADGNTLICTLSAPCAYFYDLLAFPTFLPVYGADVDAANTDGTNPGAWALEAGFVSNGAYTLTGWEHGQSMTYTKNPNYYNAAAVKTETVSLMLSTDSAAPYAAYQAGNLDILDQIPADAIGTLLSSGSSELKVAPLLGTYYMSFNTKSDIFAGLDTEQAAAARQAVSILIDREYIADNIDQTGAKAANTLVPPAMSDGNGGEFRANDGSYTYPNADTVGYYDPDAVNNDSEAALDSARELMKSAGFSFGEDGKLSSDTPFGFTLTVVPDSKQQLIAEEIQQDLTVLGITVEIDVQEWSVFLDSMMSGSFDALCVGWTCDYNDPINLLEIWTSTSGNNSSQLGK